MDKKQFQQAKQKKPADLKKDLKEMRDKLWQLRIDLASGKVKNVREIRGLKKDIARVLTIING